MERVEKFLKEAETYYLATMDGNQPRVRPFGTAHIFEGKLYIQTGKVKSVYKQLKENPNVEVCACMNGTCPRYNISINAATRVASCPLFSSEESVSTAM